MRADPDELDDAGEASGRALGGPAAGQASNAGTGNQAVWLTVKRGALRIGPAPTPAPGANEIVVRARAVAVNPVDRLLPLMGNFIAPWLTYPIVPGSDVAGEVVAVGNAVTRFKVGGRVVGHAAGLEKSRNRAAEGAFQGLVVLLEHMAAPIPADLDFADAAVLLLGLSTAACALFQAEHLALRPPVPRGQPAGGTVLVWGGSTSVGSNAIQLAVAAGYAVIATASPRNFDYVRRLGAFQVLDRRSPTVIGDLKRMLEFSGLAGSLAIGPGSARACTAVAGACRGSRRVAMVTPGVSFDAAPAGIRRALWLVPTLTRLLAANASLALRARRRKVRTSFVWGGALVDNAVGPMVYADYLPGALAEGRHAAAPPPLLAGSGLAAIPEALARLGAGVSAQKIVVRL